jgi:hypothetical protein
MVEGENEGQHHSMESVSTISRATFFQSLLVTAVSTNMAAVFVGGVGGLGKTKPITGVGFFEET